MICRIVFAVWWSVLVWAIWDHIRSSELHVWSVDRHTVPTVSVVRTFAPIQFDDASVLWLNATKDRVHLELSQTTKASMGTVSVRKATMNVYETAARNEQMETYTVDVPSLPVGQLHLTVTQDDPHYSPFRRFVIEPHIDWTLGGDAPDTDERIGYFNDGRWLEGDDPSQMFAAVLFAWCVGVIFLVVTRESNGRQKRVYKNISF